MQFLLAKVTKENRQKNTKATFLNLPFLPRRQIFEIQTRRTKAVKNERIPKVQLLSSVLSSLLLIFGSSSSCIEFLSSDITSLRAPKPPKNIDRVLFRLIYSININYNIRYFTITKHFTTPWPPYFSLSNYHSHSTHNFLSLRMSHRN